MRQDALQWKPDTCGCQLYIRVEQGKVVFLDDASVRTQHQARIDAGDPTANPVLAPPALLCREHADLGITMDKGLIPVIREEQTRRDQVLALAKTVVAGLEDFVWWFDAQRVLRVVIADITEAKRGQIQALVNSNLGAGKVVVL